MPLRPVAVALGYPAFGLPAFRRLTNETLCNRDGAPWQQSPYNGVNRSGAVAHPAW
jgi:hypothetical protein